MLLHALTFLFYEQHCLSRNVTKIWKKQQNAFDETFLKKKCAKMQFIDWTFFSISKPPTKFITWKQLFLLVSTKFRQKRRNAFDETFLQKKCRLSINFFMWFLKINVVNQKWYFMKFRTRWALFRIFC